MVYKTDLAPHRQTLIAILQEVIDAPEMNAKALERILKKHPKNGVGLFRHDELIRAYREFAGQEGLPEFDPSVLTRLQRKPTRTSSGGGLP